MTALIAYSIISLLVGLYAGMLLMFTVLAWQSEQGGWLGNDGHRYKIERLD